MGRGRSRGPREVFAGSYFLPVPGSVPTAYRAVPEGEPGWLEGVYSDETLITQLDGRTRADDVAEDAVTGSPPSSSTLPSLVSTRGSAGRPPPRWGPPGSRPGWSSGTGCAATRRGHRTTG